MTADELQRRFGAEVGTACWNEFAAKRGTEAAFAEFSARVAQAWSDTASAVRRVIIPAPRIRDVLTRAGCPTTPGEIGLAPAFYREAVRNARYLRNRYTFLDLADDAGLLAALLES